MYKTGQSSPDCNFSVNGYRLPSTDEWEYAARGGVSGKRFPWGDTVTHNQANYYSSSVYDYDISLTREWHPDYNDGDKPYTSPVGSFAPNGYGLYDMAGNIREWCNTASASGTERYIRDSSWNYGAILMRCGFQYGSSPTFTFNNFGFRSVCR